MEWAQVPFVGWASTCWTKTRPSLSSWNLCETQKHPDQNKLHSEASIRTVSNSSRGHDWHWLPTVAVVVVVQT